MPLSIGQIAAAASSRRHNTGVVPGVPTLVVAAPMNGAARVVCSPPVLTGSSPITLYTVTSSPGDFTATGANPDIIVTGLTNGTPYTFTVKATNAAGQSAASAASVAVTPKLKFTTWTEVLSEGSWTKLMTDCATWADVY